MKHKVYIYGASDDLVELEGDVSEELSPNYEKPLYLLFSTGTQVKIEYADDGVWRTEVVDEGGANCTVKPGQSDDSEEEMDARPECASVPPYSDLCVIESTRKIKLVRHGSKELKPLSDKSEKALKIIEILNDRGGFDHWWSDVETDDQNEILEEIAKVL